jgi:3-methylcrotonyl-CoA carboxylase alpha subunit
VQRRHQKVLEEAPAPGMNPEHRAAMGAAAIAAARSVGYVGAGTVEFIVEHDFAETGRFYFMEMNTRLQVEHPVTEAISGHDLVEWQLRVAAGEPLPVTQDQLGIHGHAIEARICAENPDQQFLPAIGRLNLLRTPSASAFTRADVRIDSGVREGDEITPHYDSMIAKLIVWAPDRAQALARLDAALAQLHISDLGEGGLHTNVDFLRRVAATSSFAKADLDTGLIEREQAALFSPREASPAWLAAAAAARLLHTCETGHGQSRHAARVAADKAGPAANASPWSQADGWRLQAAQGRRWLDLAVHGQTDTLHAVLVHHRDGTLALEIGGQRHALHVQALGGDLFDITLDADRRRVNIHQRGAVIEVFGDTLHTRLSLVDPFSRTTGGDAHAGQLVTQMPGRVLALLVSAGQQVSKGQPLVVTEAMKMEHTLSAPHDGTVAELLCQIGDQVAEGTELLRLDAAA